MKPPTKMERTRSKIKVEKAEQNWRRLQELGKKEENRKKASKFEEINEKNNGSQNLPPLKEIA